MLINKVALLKDVCRLQNFINIERVSDINTLSLILITLQILL